MADKRVPSLDGLIQAKGASRPDTLVQRAEASSPARALQEELQVAVAGVREPRTKSLTLRLSDTQYERLRRFAFEQRMSHQDIIERALIEHLNRHVSA